MNINLDEKRIKSIEYELVDGCVVTYVFENGEISYMIGTNKVSDQETKAALTDHEMIEAVKKSEFMGELEDARKRFKISKEIADSFPDKDENGKSKRSNIKYSDESLKVAKEIIKMDKEGKLDEILKRLDKGGKSKDIFEQLQDPDNSELSDDLSACERNMRTIEEKILLRLRMNDGDRTNSDELNKLIENYDFYKNKKKEIDDKLWDIKYPKIHPVNVTEELKKE